MARRHPVKSYGRLAALFALSFAILAAVLELLDYFGLPGDILGSVVCGVGLVALAAIGLHAGTLQTSEFYLASRAVPPAGNGAAGAMSVISGTLFVGLAGTYFAGSGTAVAATIGWCFGFLVLNVALAPYFRKSGAFGVVDFLGIRYGGGAVCIAAAIVAVAALLPATAAAFALASSIAANLLGISTNAALAIAVLLVLTTTVAGGLRAITRTAIAEYIVVASALIVPITVVALHEYGSPLPQISFGTALRDAGLLVLANGRDIATFASRGAWTWSGGSGFNAMATTIVLAAGVAALPQLLMRSAAVRSPEGARRSATWGLLFVLAVISAAPAYAAFVRYLVVRDVTDLPIEKLPDWIFTFGHLGLVKICGANALSINTVLGACSSAPGFTGNLAANDLAIAGDSVVLAAPAVFGLPNIATALVALGALAATLAAAKAAAFASASAIGHDLYRGFGDLRPSAGRQLIVTRLALVVIVAAAAWLARRNPADAVGLAPGAIAMAAGGLFPALVLGVWWKRANGVGAAAAIVSGGAVTAAIVLQHHYPGFLPFGDLHLNEITAGAVGLPIGLIAAVAASLAFEPSDYAGRSAIVDAIRRPGGTPFVQESESL
jgi:cation/acetate symporter